MRNEIYEQMSNKIDQKQPKSNSIDQNILPINDDNCIQGSFQK